MKTPVEHNVVYLPMSLLPAQGTDNQREGSSSKRPSVPSRGNLQATMISVGPVNRRTRSTGGDLTGGRGVDIQDENPNICAFASKGSVPVTGIRIFQHHTCLGGPRKLRNSSMVHTGSVSPTAMAGITGFHCFCDSFWPVVGRGRDRR
jgi:hypothetical protein